MHGIPTSSALSRGRAFVAPVGLIVGALSMACGSAMNEPAPISTTLPSSAAKLPSLDQRHPASPFQVFFEHTHDVRVFGVSGAVVVAQSQASTIEPLGQGAHLGLVAPAGISWTASMPHAFVDIVSVTGDWSKRVDILAAVDDGAGGLGIHYTLSRATPLLKANSVDKLILVGIADVPGGMLALGAPTAAGASRFVAMGPGVRVPQLTRSTENCAPLTNVHVKPTAFASTPGGVLVSVGRSCTSENLSEVWRGEAPPQVIPLPESQRFFTGPAAPSATKLLRGLGETLWFVGGDVARFDDGAWHRVTTPDDVIFDDGAHAANDTLWLVGNGRVFRLSDDRTVEVPLAGELTASGVAIDASGTVFVSAGKVILRHEPRTSAE